MSTKKGEPNWTNKLSKEERYAHFKRMNEMSNAVPHKPPRWTEDAINKLSSDLLDWIENPTSIWFEKFALERMITPQHMSRLAAMYPAFGAVYEHAKDWQKNKLIEGGLMNKLNPSITKLLLSQYGIYEKKQVQHDGAQTIQLVNYAEKNSRPKWKNDGEEDGNGRDSPDRRDASDGLNGEEELESPRRYYQEEDGDDS